MSYTLEDVSAVVSNIKDNIECVIFDHDWVDDHIMCATVHVVCKDRELIKDIELTHIGWRGVAALVYEDMEYFNDTILPAVVESAIELENDGCADLQTSRLLSLAK